MHRPVAKRAAAVVVALALSGVGLIALAPPASAAVDGALTSLSAPTVLNAANQSAGNLNVNVTSAAVAGDTIDIRVAPTTGDCATAEEAASGVAFASAVDNNANVTLSLVDDCPGAANFNNVLRLTFGGDVAAGVDIVISSIKYNIGGTVPTFPDPKVRVKLGADPYVAGNATIGKVDRLAGDTRYSTAAAVAEAQNDCAEDVVIASGVNFPDALAASFLGKPILLVETNAVPAATKAALDGLGAKNVTIVGGTEAVSSAVATTLQGYDETLCGDAAGGKLVVNRISGATRYATALAVGTSAAAGTADEGLAGACNAVKTAILVSGQNFPDALAAGTLASNGVNTGICGDGNRIPLFLTTPAGLSAEAVEGIGTSGVAQVIIVGGTQAVSAQSQTNLDALPGVSVVRIDGANRAETAKEFADMLAADMGGNYPATRVLLANGLNFPDALVAGPLGGLRFSPILLSSNPTTLGTPAADFIEDNVSVNHVSMLGGPVALADSMGGAIGGAFLARN